MKTLTKLLARFLPRRTNQPQTPTKPALSYQALYEQQAKHDEAKEVIGDGSYDLIGRIELDLLVQEGLLPGHTLVDFGCGNGRLAVHAIPYLATGSYIGTDICADFLRRADERIRSTVKGPQGQVRWVHQTGTEFPVDEASVDMMCAFSVFTHMEHEDAYRYLRAAQKVVRPGGRLIFSCLPLDLEVARKYFEAEAAHDLLSRWRHVRNVTTSRDMMTAIAKLAGWIPVRWHHGEEQTIGRPGAEKRALGQSCCVLAAPTD